PPAPTPRPTASCPSPSGPATALSWRILATGSYVAEIVDFRPQVVRRHVDRRKRDGQPEAPPARASWIQVEHAVGRVDLRHMGMTGHDDVDAARNRIDLQSLQIVQNVDRFSRKSHDLVLRVCNSPVVDIHVSSDRGNRGDATQRVDNFGTSDVAAMDDVIDASQATLRLRPEQPVRVGDEPDPEGHRWRRPLVRLG